MATGEFDLIEQHFLGIGSPRDDVALGIGDDAALLVPGGSGRLAAAWGSATKSLNEDPRAAGEGCAEAVFRQLLDAGVTPAWLTLALSIDDPDDAWAAAFAAGIHHACLRHRVSLVGGDTTAGPAAATLFATGSFRAP